MITLLNIKSHISQIQVVINGTLKVFGIAPTIGTMHNYRLGYIAYYKKFH